MNWLIGIAIWLVCGFIAYGLAKGKAKHFYKYARTWEFTQYAGYNINSELECLLFSIFGPFSLLGMLLNTLAEGKLDFCLKMPTELKEKRGKEI